MRAAKMARMATALMNSGALKLWKVGDAYV
jgi:hypothetical protein